MKRSLKNAFCIAVGILTLLLTPAFAQLQSEYKVHIDQEAALPDFLLKPGTYLFRQASVNNPDLFEVMKADGTAVGFAEAIPKQRTDDQYTEIEFAAPDAAGIRRIQAWYPGGHMNGYQFSYSHKDMRKLDEMARASSVTSNGAGQP